MKTNTLFVFNAEANNNNKKRIKNNTLFVYDTEANKKQMKNNTLFVFNAEANNNNKKVVYIGRSEVGDGETCFCEKRGPLRLLRTVLLLSQLLIKQ